MRLLLLKRSEPSISSETPVYVVMKRMRSSLASGFSSRSVVKMAEQKSVPSDLYKCVYSFLLENKFTKAAQLFLKQTKVVSI